MVDGDDREAAREWTEVVHARIAGVLDDTPSATAPRAEHETATSVVVAREPGPESAPGEREEAPAVRRPSVMERLCPEDRELVVAAAKAASAGAGPVVTVGQTLEPDTERRWVPWAEKLFVCSINCPMSSFAAL